MIDAWAESYPAGKVQTIPVAVINDLDAEWKGAVRVRLLSDATVVQEKTLPCEVAGARQDEAGVCNRYSLEARKLST